MSNFLKLASRITATEFERLQKSTPFSRLKVKALALTVFIPTIMWCLFGFLLSYGVMDNHWIPSALLGLFLGTVVFLLERLIVMGNGSWWMAGFRILLGATIAFLGAQLIDLVVFKADIENKLPAVKHTLAMQAIQDQQEQFNERNNIKSLESNVGSLDTLWRNQQQQAIDEARGVRGTGLEGAGSATKYKQGVTNDTYNKLEAERASLNKLLAIRGQDDSLVYQQAFSKISDQSILLRIKAMEMLLENESAMRHIYWGFTLFMFLLEFLAILFKLTMKKSAYEVEVDTLERLYIDRTERLYGKTSPYLQPHQIVPEAKNTSQKLSSSLNTIL